MNDLPRVFDYPVGFGKRVVYRRSPPWQRQKSSNIRRFTMRIGITHELHHADCVF